MIRATPDANIIISGFHGSGNPRRILELAQRGAIQLFVSQAILDEVVDVLQREKFGWTRAEVNYAIGRLLEVAIFTEPEQTVDVVRMDPSDNRVLECAVASRSEYLITGDKHLLALGQFGQIQIVKPTNFIEILTVGASF